MDPGRVDVVLVRPARPANVAAACRALKNMGLGSLVLVEARRVTRPRSAGARVRRLGRAGRGAGARPRWPRRSAGATLVAATSGAARGARRGRPTAVRAGRARRPRRAASPSSSGPKRRACTETSSPLCRGASTSRPTAAHPSLNLAQAVLLLAYELRLLGGRRRRTCRPEPAPQRRGRGGGGARRLGEALLAVGYLNAQAPERDPGRAARLLARAAPTAREVSAAARPGAPGALGRAWPPRRDVIGRPMRGRRSWTSCGSRRSPCRRRCSARTAARFTGAVFVPAAASHHDGPMRPEEWINDGDALLRLPARRARSRPVHPQQGAGRGPSTVRPRRTVGRSDGGRCVRRVRRSNAAGESVVGNLAHRHARRTSSGCWTT